VGGELTDGAEGAVSKSNNIEYLRRKLVAGAVYAGDDAE